MYPDQLEEDLREARRLVRETTGRGGPKPKCFIPLRTVCPSILAGHPVPERRWIVFGWLPVGHVTLNFGDGGVGKTLLAQQLMTATALGTPWCSLAVEPCRSFGLFCEDDEDELHRRQDDILRSIHGEKVDYLKLGNMLWASGVGLDNVLVRYDRDGIGQPTKRLEEIRDVALNHEARLIVLDTAADLFGGNENDRGQVRNFIGEHLNALANAIGGAVLLNAHPSKSGLSGTGDMTSGSTGWSNTARSRWSLARPTGEDGYPVRDGDERILTRRKANYSSTGDEIKLTWEKGVLAAPARLGGVAGISDRAAVELLFLDLLDRCRFAGMRLSHMRQASNFAPRTFSKRPDRQGHSKSDFETAMHSLFAVGKIRIAPYGKPSDGTQEIVRVTSGGRG